MNLPPGWHTDLAVLRLGGAEVGEHPDHLVVRSPDNPRYHWGNFVLVTDPDAVDDAARWVRRFEEEFPGARHRAVGLAARPDRGPWEAVRMEVEAEDALDTDVVPEQRPCPIGYAARALTAPADWDQQVGLALRENLRTGEEEPAAYEEFRRDTTSGNRRLVEQGVGAWFGAFHDGLLVADLGIVDCGEGVFRYRQVGTDADHRRRGLAGHLLGLAARWAQERACSRWVIITEPDNPAGRLYRSLGFAPTTPNAQAYRAPPARAFRT